MVHYEELLGGVYEEQLRLLPASQGMFCGDDYNAVGFEIPGVFGMLLLMTAGRCSLPILVLPYSRAYQLSKRRHLVSRI